jgi:two-component system, NarL family, nitrate/nitrite response regulator NarL
MARQSSFSTILVGPNDLGRERCVRILRSANYRILDSVPRADDLTDEVAPGLFLVIHIGDEFGSLAEQIRVLRTRYSDSQIAVVTDRYRPDELVSVFRAGASGYFVEGISPDVFISSLRLIIY